MLVPVRDPEALAQALKATLGRKTDASEARQRAGHFDIGAVADRYWQLFFLSEAQKKPQHRQPGT
jgi:glycosyltransferase involved in cell wall biosynthesis